MLGGSECQPTCETEKAGYSQKYTNHSITSVTGHCSQSSLKHYSPTRDKKKKHTSIELADQMNENVPEVQSNAGTILDNLPEVLLTNSQEQLILNESNQFNI